MKKSNKILAGIMAVCIMGGVGVVPETIAPAVSMTASAEAVSSGTCGKIVSWVLDEKGVLTISGEGKFERFSGENAPSDEEKATITKVVIEEGITTICNNAFKNYTAMKSVTIPESMTVINNSVFEGCTSLLDVTIPVGVTEIGTSCFSGCTNLANAYIDAELTEIPSSAFNECTSLTGIELPNTVEKIGANAFYNTSLTNIEIPDSVTAIGVSAFENCLNLETIIIPDSVTAIENKTFYNCTSLTEAVIGNGVTSIGEYAFGNCEKLGTVKFGRSIQTISQFAFQDTALSNISYNGTESDWKKINIHSFGNDDIHSDAIKYLVTYGDANKDGKVNMSDAVLIMQSISNPSEYTVTEDGIANSDIVDRGDNLTINDALAIQMIEAKLLTVDDLPITSEQIVELSNK